jgi:uncharacterized protein (DUF2267 family)
MPIEEAFQLSGAPCSAYWRAISAGKIEEIAHLLPEDIRRMFDAARRELH